MKKPIVSTLLAASLAFANVASADGAFLTLAGTKTGAVQSSVVQRGKEGRIEVIAVDHTVTGSALGKKNHGVFTITKEVDKSSPLLYRMLVTSDVASSFDLQFFQWDRSGREVMAYSVKLTGARIVDIKFRQANNKVPALAKLDDTEEISFAYDKISWTWTADGNVTASDSAN